MGGAIGLFGEGRLVLLAAGLLFVPLGPAAVPGVAGTHHGPRGGLVRRQVGAVTAGVVLVPLRKLRHAAGYGLFGLGAVSR